MCNNHVIEWFDLHISDIFSNYIIKWPLSLVKVRLNKHLYKNMFDIIYIFRSYYIGPN